MKTPQIAADLYAKAIACICPICDGRRWLVVNPNPVTTERIAMFAATRNLAVRTGDHTTIRAIPTCPALTCPGPDSRRP